MEEFLTRTVKVLTIRNNIDKLDFTQIQNLCSSENSFKRMKSQATDGRRYFQNASLAKRTLTNHFFFKATLFLMSKRIEQSLYKRRKVSILKLLSLIIRKEQIKNTVIKICCLQLSTLYQT